MKCSRTKQDARGTEHRSDTQMAAANSGPHCLCWNCCVRSAGNGVCCNIARFLPSLLSTVTVTVAKQEQAVHSAEQVSVGLMFRTNVQAVTCGTVSIIIRVFHFPYICAFVAFLSSNNFIHTLHTLTEDKNTFANLKLKHQLNFIKFPSESPVSCTMDGTTGTFRSYC